jgi:hypothetical protein
LGNLILQRLAGNNLFMSAALPRKIFPPLFNRYEGGEAFGYHVDNAVRGIAGTAERVRTDLSATLFFSEPDSYDGGELVLLLDAEPGARGQPARLAPGHGRGHTAPEPGRRGAPLHRAANRDLP